MVVLIFGVLVLTVMMTDRRSAEMMMLMMERAGLGGREWGSTSWWGSDIAGIHRLRLETQEEEEEGEDEE